LPYCGLAPIPGELWFRWNLDPVLVLALVAVSFVHLRYARTGDLGRPLAGWLIAAFAFISPICALSVALFSARILQHMVLMLLAAPLIGVALPPGSWRHSIWWSVAACSAALWVWHMPGPYTATFHSTAIYWAMHLTLFGSAIWLWRDLLNHEPRETLAAIGAGLVACVQMGLLGAVFALSGTAFFTPYEATTNAWGLSQLQDQQLGGVLMWVPGTLAFLAAALRSLLRSQIWVEGRAAR